MRILIVDDDYVSRVKLKTILSQKGDCDCAPNGNLAFELFEIAHQEKAPYNLITIDILMPGMSGQDVVRKIRNWEKHNGFVGDKASKLLMVSAKDDIKSISSSFYEECDGYCTKPITVESLNKALVKYDIRF